MKNLVVAISVLEICCVSAFTPLFLPLKPNLANTIHRQESCSLYASSSTSSGIGTSTSNDGEAKSRRLLIVGGGIGGLSSAFDAHHMIASHKLEITVVSDRQDFSFTPSNPWVATRTRTPSEISLPLKKILPRHGIQFINGKAAKLNPKSKVLQLEDGKELPYDYLIIATGPRLGVDEIPGLSKASHAHSVCTTPHAAKTADAVDELVKNPQPIVVGATQGASCFGPAYEFVLLLQHELNKRGGKKLLEQCSPISFVTAEPYIGHLGLGGAGDSANILTKLLKKKKINAFANSRIQEVKSDAVDIEQLDEEGKVVDKHRLPSALTMLIPPFRGQKVWETTKGLTTDKGMIIVNEFQQSPVYPDIFAVGVCVDIPTHEESVIPMGFPKTGYMIESMGTAAVRNIKSMIEWEDKHGKDEEPVVLRSKPMLNGICITDFGNEGAIFVTMPQIRPRRHDWTVYGKSATLAKIAFEKYFLHKIESGDTDPYYEKYFLQLIGVERTKEERTN